MKSVFQIEADFALRFPKQKDNFLKKISSFVPKLLKLAEEKPEKYPASKFLIFADGLCEHNFFQPHII